MLDFLHALKTRFSFHWDETVGIIVTSLFAGFILTFNDWGDTTFDAASGVNSLVTMVLFLVVVLFLTVSVCKIISLAFGYVLSYQPHLVGLMAGLIISVASAGYLPIFLPGGFSSTQPQRMYIGHWRGYQRMWALAFLASLFPILLLIWVFGLNLIYLVTGAELFLKFLTALSLMAIFSLIPLPNVALEYGGRVLDFFRYLKGTTFGLEIFFNSRTWYVVLTIAVLTFSATSYIITISGRTFGLVLYVISLVLGLIGLFFYKMFFEKMGSGYR